MPVRNPLKGQVALASIEEQVPGARTSLRDLDLSSLTSVAALGATLVGEGEPVHILINNAGVMQPPDRQTTPDGFELQLGTNHLGHFALVGHLLPLLQEGRARVTSQISVAVSRGNVNWGDLNWADSYDDMKAYGQSKVALGLFGLELHKRSQTNGWGITSNLSHPGVAPTSLLAARPELGRGKDTTSIKMIRALSRRGLIAGTVENAGCSALLAATSPDAQGGVLYGPSGFGNMGGPPDLQKLYRPLHSPEDARRMWEVSEEWTKVSMSVR